MANQTKNTAPNTNKNANAEPDFDSWSEEQIGFAPYWAPKEGEAFYGILQARDERDPKFVRFLVMNLSSVPLKCHRGPVDNAEEVEVGKGAAFSVSVYYQLEEPFDFYLQAQEEMGIEVPMRVTALNKVDTRDGNEVWRFRLQIEPNAKKLLNEYKIKLNRELSAKKPAELEG